MINLLQETIDIITVKEKTVEDVLWVGTKDMSFSWKEFASISDFDYYNSYGRRRIKESLLVVGKDWWLERHEYDGSEWWEFKILPERSVMEIVPTKDDLMDD